MNLRFVLTTASVLLCALSLWAVVQQRGRISALRAQRDEVLAGLAGGQPATPGGTDEKKASEPAASGRPPELLRLRNEITRLSGLKRQLAAVEKEHKELQAQLARVGSNAIGGVKLPEGYILRRNARMMGYGKPEDTVQTFLWALENGDHAALMKALTPEAAEDIGRALKEAQEHGKDMFQEMRILPGMSITGRRQVDATTVELSVTIMPDVPTQTMHLQLIDGDWKMRPF